MENVSPLKKKLHIFLVRKPRFEQNIACEEISRKISNNNFFHLPQATMKGASQVAQLVKNSPAMQESLVQFLGWEDPLEKG